MSTTLHATCVAIGGRGVLLTGPSGAGKSDLALRLIDRGAELVGDDGVIVTRRGGVLFGAAPQTIAGRIEIRGLGIVPLPFRAEVPLALCVALDRAPPRMADEVLPLRMVEDVGLPEIALAPFESTTPIKVEWALSLYGLPA